MASLVAITEDGQTIEVGDVGSEGFIVVPIVHEANIAPYRVIVRELANSAADEQTRFHLGRVRSQKNVVMLLAVSHVICENLEAAAGIEPAD
jgi:hypothetical protein